MTTKTPVRIKIQKERKNIKTSPPCPKALVFLQLFIYIFLFLFFLSDLGSIMRPSSPSNPKPPPPSCFQPPPATPPLPPSQPPQAVGAATQVRNLLHPVAEDLFLYPRTCSRPSQILSHLKSCFLQYQLLLNWSPPNITMNRANLSNNPSLPCPSSSPLRLLPELAMPLFPTPKAPPKEPAMPLFPTPKAPPKEPGIPLHKPCEALPRELAMPFFPPPEAPSREAEVPFRKPPEAPPRQPAMPFFPPPEVPSREAAVPFLQPPVTPPKEPGRPLHQPCEAPPWEPTEELSRSCGRMRIRCRSVNHCVPVDS